MILSKSRAKLPCIRFNN